MSCTNRLLSTLRKPKYRLGLVIAFWVIHLSLYFLTSNIYPLEWHRPVHCKLDDLIPFCEIFVVPYVLWYVLLLTTVVHFYRHDWQSLTRFHVYLVILDLILYTIYFVYPTQVTFQPTEFPRENVFSDLVAMIYSADRPTNACPSFHVAYSLAIGSAWFKRKQTPLWLKWIIGVLVALICLATVFIKQHSALDFFWAIPCCAVAEWVSYGKGYWLPKWKRRTDNS